MSGEKSDVEKCPKVEVGDKTYFHVGDDVLVEEETRTINYSDQVVKETGANPEDVPGTAEYEGKRRDDAAKS